MKIFDVLILVACAVLTAAANMLLKRGSGMLRFDTVCDALGSAFTSWQLLVGGMFYLSAMAGWIMLLRRAPLNLTYPALIGMTFILITLASTYLGGETFSLQKGAGCLFILAGIITIATA